MNRFEEYILKPFIHSARLFRDRNAFYIDGEYYSYGSFWQRVAAIQKHIPQNDGTGDVIALAIHDDLDTYATIFALWMVGKAYVPLHPNQPLDRNLNIIGQVGTNCIFDTQKESAFSEWGNESDDRHVIITTELVSDNRYDFDMQNVDDEELAYILFTSGSTGVPKGVQISRKNVAAFIDSFWKTGIEINEEDRCMQVFDLTFDVSVQSFIVALTRGACVYTVPYGQVKYLQAASLIQMQHITFGAMAPSMLRYLRPYFDEMDATSLKACILTAEACPVDLMEDWFRCATNTDIYDFYGPTEATVYCTYYKLSREESNRSLNGIISIGKPLANVEAIIVDENGSIINDQSKGELCIAGDHLSPGYWKNQEKNESAFFEKKYRGIVQRFYHTGDLCYWDESGNIMYSGRIDQQAKIQGFRVELGEIEYHAREYFHKEKNVIAIAFQDKDNLTEIALFIESEQKNSDDLMHYLRSKMPSYMIPTRIVYEPEFPLNKSEKIDRNALKNRLR